MADEHLISKKELLARYGISYGALYRWKRKGLIPDEWFIKRATVTGQETFFPERLICERMETVLQKKEDVLLDELAQQLSFPVDTQLLIAACLLHDLTRGAPDHPRSGAQVLAQAGYPGLAELVAVHHDLPEEASAEACLLYLADKLVQGERRVSLESRFLASREKCRTPEALAAWQQRYDRTQRIIQTFQLILPD